MNSNPHDVPPSVNIPDELDPTPPDERENVTKFDTSARKSEKQIGEELERFDVDRWYVETAPTASHDNWPGYVVRWTKDGVDYALISDSYTTKKANARTAYYWIHETRMRAKRPVTTAHDSLAAAALPSGATALPGGEAEAVPPDPEEEPYTVLGIEPPATDEEIQAAYRERMSDIHPDQNDGEQDEAVRVNKARDVLLDDG